MWKSFLSLRPMAKRFIYCQVISGKNASFWHDHWTPIGPLIDRIGDMGPRLLGLPLDASVSTAVTSSGWKLPSHRSRSLSLLELCQALLAQPIPDPNGEPDEYCWRINGTDSTTYSSKLTWEASRPSGAIQPWAKDIWYRGNVAKHAFSFWVVHLDRLPLRTRLCSWGLHIADICCLCDREPETRNHLFFTCDFSKQIWTKILARLGLNSLLLLDWDSLLAMFSSQMGSTPKTLRRLVGQVAIYYIWRERNNRLHNALATPTEVLFKAIDKSIREAILGRLHRRNFMNLLSWWFLYDL